MGSKVIKACVGVWCSRQGTQQEADVLELSSAIIFQNMR